MSANNYLLLRIVFGLAFMSLFCSQNSFAQLPKTDTATSLNNKRHSINFELAGSAFLFGSVKYEYALTDDFSVGAGLGISNISAGDITRDNNGSPETGSFFDTSTSQTIFGNYFIGKKKHKLVLTAGLVNFLSLYRNNYPSEVEFFGNAELEWNIGVGYQLNSNDIYFKLMAYLISTPNESVFFPKYLPWPGITIGKKIK